MSKSRIWYRFLITNNHVLNESDTKIGNNFTFSLKNDESNNKIIFDNKRKTYTNKEYDITIIELKKNDGLSGYKFLEVDDDIFMDNPNNYYSNKTIYIIHYPHGKKVEFSVGVIKIIFEDGYSIAHLCSTETGSSGGPLINLLNHKVIGLHKGSKENKNFNLGTLLKIPIQEFNQKYPDKMNNKLQMKKNTLYNKNINNNIENKDFNVSENKNINYNNKPNIINGKKSEILYPYIKGERKEIAFINSKKIKYLVKIPKSLRKNDIYSIAKKYRTSLYSEITKLIHNNKLLENNDSSIDCILNGDSIKIIECLDWDETYLSYSDSLLLKHKNSPMIYYIYFAHKSSGEITILHLPIDITVNEMKKIYLCKKGIPFKFIDLFDFIFNCKKM